MLPLYYCFFLIMGIFRLYPYYLYCYGHIYFFQKIGSSVVTKEGEEIGKVKDFLCIQNNDLLVVAKGSREILVPFTYSICLKVNLEQKEILVDLPEGLLELNEI